MSAYRVCLSVIAVAAMSVILSGCSSTGSRILMKETGDSVDAKITDGKTTKQEIRTMFGDPMAISFTDGGREIWRYVFVYMQHDPQNFINPFMDKFTGTKKQLVVLFEDDGMVMNHTFSETPREERSGYFK